MKPRDLFLAGVDAHLVSPFRERGFKFRRSTLDFVRPTASGVRQRVAFQLSRWNSEDNCEFWSSWGASAAAYIDWFVREWNRPPDADDLGGLADWNIPGWNRRPDQHFELRNRSTDLAEWRAFLENCDGVGFPFLERISSWEGAAEQLCAERWHFDRASDFLLIAGHRESARAMILEGINTFEQAGRVDNFGELPRLRERLDRYFRIDDRAT
jgi:hypothetical protein